MTPIEHTMKIERVADRALGYGMPGVRVDGNDPIALYGALSAAVERARSGGGPTLVECVTFRFRGHYFGDRMTYISEDRLAEAQEQDPVPAFRERLARERVCTGEELDRIDADAEAEVEDVVQKVLGADAPAVDEVGRDVFANAENCPA
jgi:pyruvate dehydrogenase E1 component alpha subunit